MASELRVNTINSRTGFGTITVSETGQDLVGITTIENLTAENTLVGAAASFTGNVSIGGVLTYEDVTNIDSVGLITARQGIEIGARPGVAASISADGNMIVSGISTFGGSLKADGGIDASSQTVTVNQLDLADTIVHGGDTNTKIRFPAADTITAETAGTERFRIASDGKVAIGNASPQQLLHVWPDTANTTSAYVRVTAGDRGSGTGIDIGHDASGNGHVNMVSNGHLSLSTNNTERIKISNTGITIIGDSIAQLSTSAERPLQVHSINGPKIAIGRNDTSITDGNTIGGLEFYGNDANGTFVNTAAIIVNADGTHGDNDKPTRMQFYTTAASGSSATERLRISNNGYVQVGAAADSAAAPFHVTAENSQGINAIFGAKGFVDSNNYNYADANIALQGRDAGDSDTGAGIQFTVRNTGNSNWLHGAITMSNAGHQIFTTGGAGNSAGEERMRIMDSGKVLIGTTVTNDTSGLGFKFHPGTIIPYMTTTSNSTSNTHSTYHLYNTNATNNGYRFYAQVNGGLANYSANNQNLCDEREKKDITDAPSQLSKVKAWKLRNFRYNTEPNSEPLKFGVIAQEIETVNPDLVSEEFKVRVDDDGNDVLRKGVKEEQMMMISIKALQELITKVETLETKVAALESS